MKLKSNMINEAVILSIGTDNLLALRSELFLAYKITSISVNKFLIEL